MIDFEMEALENLLEKAEPLDWSYNIIDDYVELEKHSPAGEDFIMSIDFKRENPVESFLDDLKSYAEDFDVDEHAEIWIDSRGKNGVPSSLKALLDDAAAIYLMIEELYDELSVRRGE